MRAASAWALFGLLAAPAIAAPPVPVTAHPPAASPHAALSARLVQPPLSGDAGRSLRLDPLHWRETERWRETPPLLSFGPGAKADKRGPSVSLKVRSLRSLRATARLRF